LSGDEIQVRRVRVRDLCDLAWRTYEASEPEEVVPISKARALAQANNPSAEAEDLGLLLALQNGRPVGYLGLLPGWLKLRKERARVWWLSTWFVPPRFRKGSVGAILLMNAMALGRDLVVTGMSAEAEKVYRRAGFRELGRLHYGTLDLSRLNLMRLALRAIGKVGRLLGRDLDAPDAVWKAAAFLYRPSKRILFEVALGRGLRDLSGVSYEEVSQIHERAGVESCPERQTEFLRGIGIINWMLRHRWVKQAHEVEPADLRYRFGEVCDVFKYVALTIHSPDRKEYKGFLVLSFSVRNSTNYLKVLDFHTCDPGESSYCLALALKYARELDADLIDIPESLGKYLEKRRFAKLLLLRKARVYLCRPAHDQSPLARALPEIQLNYCDGDTAFT